MTTKLVTKNLKNHLTSQLVESFTEPANNVYYLFVSKHTEFDDDNNPPTPVDNVEILRSDLFKEMIFGKKITNSDIMPMIKRYNWTTNTVYDVYRDDTDLFTKNFYAVVDNGAQYFVYKVLNNNNGATSTISPISSTDESACNFITSDGYVWKLMYKMNEATFEKFATTDYMPVATSANVAGNTIKGAIDVILVTNNGSDYASFLSGQFNSDDVRDTIPGGLGNNVTYRLATNASTNTNFYAECALYITSGTGAGQLKRILAYNPSNRIVVVNSAFTTPPDSTSSYLIYPNIVIEGDGSGAQGYAVIGANATVNGYISSVVVTNRGNNYTYATATVAGNTGGQTNTAVLKVVIPPEGGHGKNALAELGSSYVGISVTLSNSESGYLTTNNDFRTYGIIKDILYRNITLGLDDITGTFSNSETIYQVNYKSLVGNASVSTATNTIDGSFTEFDKSLSIGDNIILFDTAADQQCLRTVTGVANSSRITISSNCSFTSNLVKVAHTSLLASCIKIGNTLPFLTASNAEPKFTIGKYIIGSSSGAMANVANIVFNDKAFSNWNYYDNRTKINYSSINGTPVQDAVVYQEFVELSNAYYHSHDSTYVYLTSEKGPINADPDAPLVANDGTFSFDLTSTKYEPDIVDGAGEVLYIENNSPISRSNSQSETFRIILDF